MGRKHRLWPARRWLEQWEKGIEGRIVEQALAESGPSLIEAVVDPFKAPLPAKITLDQATKFAKSLIKGEPNREKIALTVFGDKIGEMI